jgi:hypothetical protein
MREVNEIFNDFESDEISKRILAIEESCSIIKTLTDKILDYFKNTSERFLIAERLPSAGRAIVSPLEDLLVESNDREIRILTSLVLLELGSYKGKDILLEAIDFENEYIHLILKSLAGKKVNEAKIKIIDKILRSNVEDIDLLISLLNSLNCFTKVLPDEVINKFSTTINIPWQIKLTLKEDWSVFG